MYFSPFHLSLFFLTVLFQIVLGNFGWFNPINGGYLRKYDRTSNCEIQNEMYFLSENNIYRRETKDTERVAGEIGIDTSKKIAKFCLFVNELELSAMLFKLTTSGEAHIEDGESDGTDAELKKYAPIFDIKCSQDTYLFRNRDGWYCFSRNNNFGELSKILFFLPFHNFADVFFLCRHCGEFSFFWFEFHDKQFI